MFQKTKGREGMHFPGCRAVHTSFVLGKLDILFLDGAKQIVRSEQGVGPFRFLTEPRADSVLELPGGTWAALSREEKASLLGSLPRPGGPSGA